MIRSLRHLVSFGSFSVLGTVLAASAAAACGATSTDHEVGQQIQEVTPEDRMLIGIAERYPGDPEASTRTSEFTASMKARREFAWRVVEKVLSPVPIAAPKLDPDDPDVSAVLPRFQTWYGKNDVVAAFDQLWVGMKVEDPAQVRDFRQCEVDSVFRWNAEERPKNLSTWNRDVYKARRAELSDAEGVSSLGRNTRVLMSPAFVSHVLRNYRTLAGCVGKTMPLTQPPLSTENHTRCMTSEFPVDAAVIKAGWEPDGPTFPAYDTSATDIQSMLAAGTWPAPRAIAPPGPDAIYTMRALTASSGQPRPERKRLTALHILTKELRDWVWISLFWSEQPNLDFGADRPESIRALGGPWSHYKMVVTTAYDEDDPDPGSSYAESAPTLASALRSARPAPPPEATTVRTWASNPYIEREARNGATNCIGCHAHGGTKLSVQGLLDDEAQYPDNTRRKVRAAFPADYTWVTSQGGMDLGAIFKETLNGARTPSRLPGTQPASCAPVGEQ
ncbi:hypothetical protein LVJ94_34240 [Pendulispora rubella]|uniref:Cytochrome c domain-containing protein n=1 Tax=Pendulispora rubella TaxID=2741070 RepID=A0ABZ2KYB2_9BACT